MPVFTGSNVFYLCSNAVFLQTTNDVVLVVEFHPTDANTIVTCGKSHIFFWSWNGNALARKQGIFGVSFCSLTVTVLIMIKHSDLRSAPAIYKKDPSNLLPNHNFKLCWTLMVGKKMVHWGRSVFNTMWFKWDRLTLRRGSVTVCQI